MHTTFYVFFLTKFGEQAKFAFHRFHVNEQCFYLLCTKMCNESWWFPVKLIKNDSRVFFVVTSHTMHSPNTHTHTYKVNWRLRLTGHSQSLLLCVRVVCVCYTFLLLLFCVVLVIWLMVHRCGVAHRQAKRWGKTCSVHHQLLMTSLWIAAYTLFTCRFLKTNTNKISNALHTSIQMRV